MGPLTIIIGTLIIATCVTIIAIKLQSILYYFGIFRQSKKFFIKNIAMEAWHDDELLDMKTSGFVYLTLIPLKGEELYHIDKELRKRSHFMKINKPR